MPAKSANRRPHERLHAPRIEPALVGADSVRDQPLRQNIADKVRSYKSAVTDRTAPAYLSHPPSDRAPGTAPR